jgi:ubiquinone biosynthesis protein UbiJ
MFRLRGVVIGLALEHFKKNIKIVFTEDETSFLTQHIHNLYCVRNNNVDDCEVETRNSIDIT